MMTAPTQHEYRPVLWLLVAMAVTVAVYWTGLHGPFLLDDAANLGDIPQWLDGKLGLASLVFERGAGTLGRPVSMASFALTSWLGGATAFSFKLGNLLVHLACGAALFGFLRQLLRLDPDLRETPARYAVIVAALWLLHPLHASTVLYSVQRMAQLSTLFVLLGLWLYVTARMRLQRDPTSKRGAAELLLGIPALTVVGFLAKENGALLPLLCAVLELVWFRTSPRPWPARLFLCLYVLFPFVAAAAYLILHPGHLSFAGRDFTMFQRMLSQGRALCDYLWKLVVPNPPTMGVYTDDFTVSTGLLSPPTTLIALLVLALLTVVAWRLRKRLPAVCFGWFFFLAAHALEAGPIGLELYFEHRNYLPSVGILLALVALVAAAGRALSQRDVNTHRIGIVMLAGVLALLAFGTHGRALVWRSDVLIAETSLKAHPHSLRANAAVMSSALRVGNRVRANEALAAIIGSTTPRDRAMGHAYRMTVECAYDGTARIADLNAFIDGTPMPLTRNEYQPVPELYNAMEQRSCAPLDDAMVGNALVRLADRADRHGSPTAAFRFQAARFLVRAGKPELAVVQARIAWPLQSSPVAVQPLVEALLQTGGLDEAERALQEARQRADATNADDTRYINWLQQRIDAARKSANSAKEPAP